MHADFHQIKIVDIEVSFSPRMLFEISNLRTDKQGCTPFYLAAQEGHVAVVKHFLRVEGVDVNLGQSKKITPLIIAAMNGYVEIVKVESIPFDYVFFS